ncbi:DUF4974 domain-containing protein [Dyadobacter flavalbus]|uniref:DUF4974 domain-containing protein n=1 Tax=Dyadobacter flavalbus TaxID=2579942 RepID=A0A5M8QUT3_9BACT|nr:FecR family protein [Dyadobacter flavalbus]KAA6439048.1 DUF4974 domain-containing protein [Dyadobacter flavalbus]
MDQYNNFKLEDFIWDAYFRKWVLHPTRETEESWHLWLENNPDKTELVLRAAGIVKAVAPVSIPLDETEKKLAISGIVSKMDSSAEEILHQPVSYFSKIWLRSAAVIMLLAGLGWILWTRNQQRQVDYKQLVAHAEEQLVEKINHTRNPLLIRLPDGSTVKLSPGGRISFPAKSRLTREVYLSGEAFFDITRDSSRPFFVYANEVVTKVLGTSFSVRSYSGEKQVSVSVRTGKVAVFTRRDAEMTHKQRSKELTGVVIEPNQQIVVSRESVKMIKSLVSSPQIIADGTVNYNFEFDDVPASEVFAALRRAYGIDSRYDSEMMNDCPVTARLTDLPLYEKLDLVCKAINATYERTDASIIIKGNGCGQAANP